jgi:hypothetical protein
MGVLYRKCVSMFVIALSQLITNINIKLWAGGTEHGWLSGFDTRFRLSVWYRVSLRTTVRSRLDQHRSVQFSPFLILFPCTSALTTGLFLEFLSCENERSPRPLIHHLSWQFTALLYHVSHSKNPSKPYSYFPVQSTVIFRAFEVSRSCQPDCLHSGSDGIWGGGDVQSYLKCWFYNPL